MGEQLENLAAVLEETIAVGEQLRSNIQAQEQALVDWDSAGLVEQIEAREPWLRLLGQLEQRRAMSVQALGSADPSPTLRSLIAALPQGAPERERLGALRERCRQVFSRLQSEERNLCGLMENLSAHIQDVLSPLAQPSLPLYGETGAAETQICPATLIHNKA